MSQDAHAAMYPGTEQQPAPPTLESTQDALARLAKGGVVLARRVAVVVLAVWLAGCASEPAPPRITTCIGLYVQSPSIEIAVEVLKKYATDLEFTVPASCHDYQAIRVEVDLSLDKRTTPTPEPAATPTVQP